MIYVLELIGFRRRLVEWNKVIFDVWTPSAWADVLEELSSSNAPWSLWPPEEKHAYWNNLTSNLVKEVLRRNLAVFPVVSDVASFLSLDHLSVLISPPSFPLNLSHLLTKLGVEIVRPPAHIFAVLASDDVTVAARILSPETLHGVLEAGYRHGQWQPHDPNTVSEIIEYLVFSTSPPSLGNLIGPVVRSARWITAHLPTTWCWSNLHHTFIRGGNSPVWPAASDVGMALFVR